MSGLSEDTRRILAYEQIITWKGVVLLLVHNTKVMSRWQQGQTWEKYWKYPFCIGAVNYPVLERTDGDTLLVGYHFNTHF